MITPTATEAKKRSMSGVAHPPDRKVSTRTKAANHETGTATAEMIPYIGLFVKAVSASCC
jgi:hypothetical protein